MPDDPQQAAPPVYDVDGDLDKLLGPPKGGAAIPKPPIATLGYQKELKAELGPTITRVVPPLLAGPFGMGAAGLAGFAGSAAAQTGEIGSGQRKAYSPLGMAVDTGLSALSVPGINRIPNPILRTIARGAEGATLNTAATGTLAMGEQGRLPTWEEAKRSAEMGGAVGGVTGGAMEIPSLVREFNIRRRPLEAEVPAGGIPEPPTPAGAARITPDQAAAVEAATPAVTTATMPKGKVPKVPGKGKAKLAGPTGAYVPINPDVLRNIGDNQLNAAIEDLGKMASAKEPLIQARLEELRQEQARRSGVVASPHPAVDAELEKVLGPTETGQPWQEAGVQPPAAEAPAAAPAAPGAEIPPAPAAEAAAVPEAPVAAPKGKKGKQPKLTAQQRLVGPQQVGGTYRSGYWGKNYTVEAINPPDAPNAAGTITARWEDGTTTTHSTAWDPKRDKVVAPPNEAGFANPQLMQSVAGGMAGALLPTEENGQPVDIKRRLVQAALGALAGYHMRFGEREPMGLGGETDTIPKPPQEGSYLENHWGEDHVLGYEPHETGEKPVEYSPEALAEMQKEATESFYERNPEEKNFNEWAVKNDIDLLGGLEGKLPPDQQAEFDRRFGRTIGPRADQLVQPRHPIADSPEFQQLAAKLRNLDKPSHEWSPEDQANFDEMYKGVTEGGKELPTSPEDFVQGAGPQAGEQWTDIDQHQLDNLQRSWENGTYDYGAVGNEEPAGEQPYQDDLNKLPQAFLNADRARAAGMSADSLEQVLRDFDLQGIDTNDPAYRIYHDEFMKKAFAESDARDFAVTGENVHDFHANLQGQDNQALKIRQGFEYALSTDAPEGMALRQIFDEEGLTPAHLELLDLPHLQQLEDTWHGRLAEADGDEMGGIHPRAMGALGGAAVGGITGAYEDPEHPLRGGLIGAGLGAVAGYAGSRFLDKARTNPLHPDNLPPELAPSAHAAIEIASAKAEPTIPTAPERSGPELSKMAGSVNVNRLDSTYGIQSLYHKLYTSYKAEIDAARQAGGVGWDQTQQIADQLGLPLDVLRAGLDKTRDLAAHVKAVRDLTLTLGHDLFEKYDATTVDPYDPVARAELTDAFVRFKEFSVGANQIAAETGRALNIHRANAQNKILTPEALDNLNTANAQLSDRDYLGLRALLGQARALHDPALAARILHQATKPNFAENVYFTWINGLLSSIPTHLANSFGNVGGMGLMIADSAFAPIFEQIAQTGRAALGKGTVRTRANGEVVALLRGLVHGLDAGLTNAKYSLATGQSLVSMEPARGLEPKVDKNWQWHVGLPVRGLVAEDAFFKNLVLSAAHYQLAYRKAWLAGERGVNLDRAALENVKNTDDKDALLAHAASLYWTLNEALGKHGQTIARMKTVPVMKWILPFIKIGINTTKMAVNHTAIFSTARMPVRLLATQFPETAKQMGLRSQIYPNRPTPDMAYDARVFQRGGEMSDDMGKWMTGVALAATAWGMQKADMITGSGPADPQQQNVWRINHQAYSIRVPGTKQWISYIRFAPIGNVLGMATDYNTITEDVAKGNFVDAGGHLSESLKNTLINQNFLSGLTNLLRLVDNTKTYAQTFAEQTVGSAVPAVAARTTSALDPTIRDPQGMVQSVERRIPGAETLVRPQRDAFGRPVHEANDLPEPLGAIERFTSPFRRQAGFDDPVLDAYERLGIGVLKASDKVPRNANVLDTDPDIAKYEDLDKNLTDQDRDTLEDARGRARYWAVHQLVTNPSFAKAPNSIQRNQIKAVASRAVNGVSNTAKIRLRQHLPITLQSIVGQTPPPPW